MLVLLSCVASANAGSSPQSPHTTTLKSSSGGTALSKAGGNGGTGVPTTANAPLGSLQSTFKPAHAIAPPPAGVRPHTDLAAAEKRTDLSSRSITKQSSLYNKIVLAPGDPRLVGAYAAKLGSKDGGGASVKQTPGFTDAESKGNVYVTTGGIDNNSRETASLSTHGVAATALTSEIDTDEAPRKLNYSLLDWLLMTVAAIAACGIGVWLWQQAPKGARMTLPAKMAA